MVKPQLLSQMLHLRMPSEVVCLEVHIVVGDNLCPFQLRSIDAVGMKQHKATDCQHDPLQKEFTNSF